MALSKFLLVRVDFVQLTSHLSIPAAHLATKNVPTLGGSTWLTLDGARAVPVDLGHHLHLIRIVHDKLLSVATISSVRPLASRNNFALRSDSWDFIVVLLYR